MAKVNKVTFEVTVDDKKISLDVCRPKNAAQIEGQRVYNKAFSDALLSKAILRAKIEKVLEEQGLWNEEKQKEWRRLVRSIQDGEKKLKMGGIKKSEAKKIAVQLRKDRGSLRLLNFERNQLDVHSAEAQAEQAKFNYFVSVCTVYSDSGEKFFKDYEDYLNRADEEVAGLAASKLAVLLFDWDEDFAKNLEENKFLLKYGFCDDKLNILENGKPVDFEGNPIEETEDLTKLPVAEFLDD